MDQMPSQMRCLPKEWEDDMQMTVLFSPFRDRNMNPKSWDQKLKFWSELILNECLQSNQGLIDLQQIKEKFQRNGKTSSCLETVLAEMVSKGQLKKLSEENRFTDSWLYWGFDTLVKKPFRWGMKWLSRQQNLGKETFVVVDVIKRKANLLLEARNCLSQSSLVNIVEYSHLRDDFRELCATDTEFSLVMQELLFNKQVIIQQAENNTTLVKFTENKLGKKLQINEQDIHIHRIQKTEADVKQQIDILSAEVNRLASEAIAYKKQGIMNRAMSCMRMRKLIQMRIDKLTGSVDMLENLQYRIQQAKSNEMVLQAIQSGTNVLKKLTDRTPADEVEKIMDNLADVTQSQEDIMADLSNMSLVDEPSQSELEDELSYIIQEDMALPENCKPSLDNSLANSAKDDVSDDVLGKALSEILKNAHLEASSQKAKMVSDVHTSSQTNIFEDLHLPDVPTHSLTKPSKVSAIAFQHTS